MCKLQTKHKRKAIELKLKQYEILYTAYADEIRNLWTRSVFLGAFMVLVWSGYGALQLKFIEKWNSDFNMNLYNYASLGLCAVIIVLSLLWIAMAKGSKFVQEAHEAHIARYNELDFLFCSLDDYQKGCYDTDKMQYTEHPTTKPLKPYRYSPSRINIALGWLSGIISSILGFMHIIIANIAHGKFECLATALYYTNLATDYAWLDIVAFFIFIVACMGLILHKADEQNDTNNKQIKEKGAKMAKYTPKTRDELKELVKDSSIYLGDIDTSNITDMSKLFMGWGSTRKDFSGIESWDISNVVTMKYMFHSVKTFNCNINDWNVSKVIDMSFMFALADSFNQPLNKWDTSSVVSMYGMFFRAKSFNQPLDNWDTSSVEFMTRMFEEAKSFNQNIDSWDVSSIRDNQQMFWDSGINKLPKWHKKRAIVDLADLAVSDIVEWGDRAKKIYSIKDNLVAEAIANPRPKKPKIAPQDKPQSNRANDSVSTWLGLDDIKPPSKGKVILSAIVLIAIIAVPRIIDTIEDWQNKNKATTQSTQTTQPKQQQPTANMPRYDDRGLLNHIIQSYKNFLVDVYQDVDLFTKWRGYYQQQGINVASAEEIVNSFKHNIINVRTKSNDEVNRQITCEVKIEEVHPIPQYKPYYSILDYRAQLMDNNSVEAGIVDIRNVDR